jgi:tRNA G18 (ribose-2'-O)-methylase SpoU
VFWAVTAVTTLVAELARLAVAVEEIGARAFAQLADTETPQGIIAVIEPRRWSANDFAPQPGAVALIIDGVQDPGNVGTLIRTAHALGAAGTVVLRGTADPTSPKALRAAMGATFRHPVVALEARGDAVGGGGGRHPAPPGVANGGWGTGDGTDRGHRR